MQVRHDDIMAATFRAALDPSAWSDVIAGLSSLFSGAAAHFLGQDRTYQGSMPVAFHGYEDDAVGTFDQHFQFINPLREGWSNLPAGTVCSHASLIGEAAWRRTEYYNDWIRPQGMSGVVGVVLALEPSRVFAVGIQTVDDRTEAIAFDAMKRLFSHMRHALDVNRALLGLRLDSFAVQAGNEPGASAILLLTATGTCCYANAAAEHLLASGEMLALSPTGRLKAREPALQSRIDARLVHPGRPERLRLRAGSQTTLADLLHIDDRMCDSLAPGPLGRALAPRLALILSTEREEAQIADLIAARLGLTRTEAQIAQALADGRTLAEISDLRGASLNTVRNQVKSILTKTGCRRQSELVALVLRLGRG